MAPSMMQTFNYYTDEHKMIQQTARDFAQKEIAPIAAEHDESKEFPHETIRKMGEMGFMGIEVPEKYGGAEMDALAYVLAVEEMLERTESEWGPWTIVESTDRRHTRMKIFKTLISRLEERLEALDMLPEELDPEFYEQKTSLVKPNAKSQGDLVEQADPATITRNVSRLETVKVEVANNDSQSTTPED